MLTTHAPGIYFNMSEEEYHADPSLSQSGMKLLKISALTYWDKCLNPNKPGEETTPAKEFGKAVECLLLEPKRFAAEYVEELTLPEGTLKTVDDLKQWLEESGAEYKKSAAKPVLIQTIRALDPEVPIADVLIAEFHAANAGKKIIGRDTMQEINNIVGALKNHPDGYHITEGGAAQVSLFWLEGDVPMKARLDFLKPRYSTDLKTYTNVMRKANGQVIDELASRDYLIQAFVDTRAVEQVVDGINRGEYSVHGEEPWKGFLNELYNEIGNRGFCFAFVESSRPYNVGFKTIMPDQAYWTHIEAVYFNHLALWREGMEKCGVAKEWRFTEGTTALTDDQVPVYVFNQLGGREPDMSA